jgi:serine/threonine protein kinase
MEKNYFNKYQKYRIKYELLKKELYGGVPGVIPDDSLLPLNYFNQDIESTHLKSGAYGCVYKPPKKCNIPCEKPDCKTGISKIMLKYEADKEELIYSQDSIFNLVNIDPYNKYYIGLGHVCTPEKIPDDCHIYLYEEEVKMIIYKDGGMDLKSFLHLQDFPYSLSKDSNINFVEILELTLIHLENIFEAVTIFNSNGVYHFDIKIDNIVTNVPIPRPGQPRDYTRTQFRLIDFGLAKKYNQVEGIKVFQSKYSKSNKFNYPYYIWPIDTIFLKTPYMMSKTLSSIDQKIFSEEYDVYLREYYLTNYFIKSVDYKKYFDKSQVKSKKLKILDKKHLRIIYKENIENDEQYTFFCESILKTIDTFSLGILLLVIVRAFREKNDGITDIRIIKIINELEQFIFDSHILHPNPILRPDGQKILDLYRNFLIKLKLPNIKKTATTDENPRNPVLIKQTERRNSIS